MAKMSKAARSKAAKKGARTRKANKAKRRSAGLKAARSRKSHSHKRPVRRVKRGRRKARKASAGKSLVKSLSKRVTKVEKEVKGVKRSQGQLNNMVREAMGVPRLRGRQGAATRRMSARSMRSALGR